MFVDFVPDSRDVRIQRRIGRVESIVVARRTINEVDYGLF